MLTLLTVSSFKLASLKLNTPIVLCSYVYVYTLLNEVLETMKQTNTKVINSEAFIKLNFSIETFLLYFFWSHHFVLGLDTLMIFRSINDRSTYICVQYIRTRLQIDSPRTQ